MTKQRIALILSLFALGIAGCGGDDDDDEATTIPTVPLSVPGEETSTIDESTDTTADTVPDATPTPAPAPAPEADCPRRRRRPTRRTTTRRHRPGPRRSSSRDFCAENPGA